jgi:hypothetical protein
LVSQKYITPSIQEHPKTTVTNEEYIKLRFTEFYYDIIYINMIQFGHRTFIRLYFILPYT